MVVSAVPQINSVFYPLWIGGLIFEIRTDVHSWIASQAFILVCYIYLLSFSRLSLGMQITENE